MLLKIKSLLVLTALLSAGSVSAACSQLLDHDVRKLAEEDQVNLCEAYQGKVLLVINSASKCGYTGQFEGLEALHSQYQDQGFAVLGFPSGDFANQEYREEGQVRDFCRLTYGVQFPMFEKSHVAGEQASPFWRDLIAESGVEPRWNFYKYLIGRDGKVIQAFPSQVAPENAELMSPLISALAEDRPKENIPN